MKHIKIILMALGFVLSLASASAIKRPTEIQFHHFYDGHLVKNGELNSIKCHYDAIGRLDTVHFVVIHILSGTPSIQNNPKGLGGQVPDTVIATLAWQDNSVTIKGQEPWSHQEFQYTYVLDNGRASEQNGDVYNQKYFYNASGELTDVMYRYGREDMTITSYTRSNGNITKITGFYNDFREPLYRPFVNHWSGDSQDVGNIYTPGEYANPAGIDFTLLETMPYNNQIMTLACIDGKHSHNLPAKRGSGDKTEEYSYEFDAYGYPVKIKVSFKNRVDVVELKYEEFPNDNTGGVNGIENGADNLTVNGRTVTGQEGSVIRAYDLQGRQVASSADGTLTLPDAGVYILRSGSKTLKAAVR